MAEVRTLEVNFNRPEFKFSAAHFTVFSESTAEALHGHNYQIDMTIRVQEPKLKNGLLAPFSEFKSAIRLACEKLDEKVLIPGQCPYLKILPQSEQLKIVFSKKEYLLPIQDVEILPVNNITSENLACFLFEALKPLLHKILGNEVKFGLGVGVTESYGQRCFYSEVLE